jgi:hypothetical protein
MGWYKKHKNEDTIIKLFNILNNNNFILDGGNCGQAALAVYRFLKDKYRIFVNIGVITESENEDELINNDPYIYHAYIFYNNKRYDCNGIISKNNLINLSKDQYQNEYPFEYIFYLPEEYEKLRKIIYINTNWKTEWTEFYKILEKELKNELV